MNHAASEFDWTKIWSAPKPGTAANGELVSGSFANAVNKSGGPLQRRWKRNAVEITTERKSWGSPGAESPAREQVPVLAQCRTAPWALPRPRRNSCRR